jgi:hypothetical protein
MVSAAIVTAATAVLENAGRQASGDADTDQCEKHRNLE